MSSAVFQNAIRDLIVSKQYATASWALALYEYIITFNQELSRIWSRPFSIVTILWVINRYVFLVSFTPTILFFFIPLSSQQCQSFVKFPGIMQIILNISTGITLSIRTYALYGKKKWIISCLSPFLLAEVAVEAWAVSGGVPVPLPNGYSGCILTGKSTQGDRFAAFWVGQLVFPMVIFILTIAKGASLYRDGTGRNRVLEVMLRDGLMYFLVIFLANLVNVITYVVSPPDLQAVNAPFSNMITALIICRLILNLRANPSDNVSHTNMLYTGGSLPNWMVTPKHFLGDLGNDVHVERSGSGDEADAGFGVEMSLFTTMIDAQ